MRIVGLETTPFHVMSYETSGPGGKIRRAELPFLRAESPGASATGPLLFSADLQGRVDGDLLGVALAEEIELLVELNEMPRPAGIVLVGDLYDHPELRKLGASGDVTEVFSALRTVAPVIGVLGNHDRMEGDVPKGCAVLDGDVQDWRGIAVGGVGGIIGSPKRPMRRSAAEFQGALRQVLSKRPDLLLLHQGPPGRQDQIGSDEIKDVLRSSRELLLACGHCHWQDPLGELGNVQILNVDARVVLVTSSTT